MVSPQNPSSTTTRIATIYDLAVHYPPCCRSEPIFHHNKDCDLSSADRKCRQRQNSEPIFHHNKDCDFKLFVDLFIWAPLRTHLPPQQGLRPIGRTITIPVCPPQNPSSTTTRIATPTFFLIQVSCQCLRTHLPPQQGLRHFLPGHCSVLVIKISEPIFHHNKDCDLFRPASEHISSKIPQNPSSTTTRIATHNDKCFKLAVCKNTQNPSSTTTRIATVKNSSSSLTSF